MPDNQEIGKATDRYNFTLSYLIVMLVLEKWAQDTPVDTTYLFFRKARREKAGEAVATTSLSR